MFSTAPPSPVCAISCPNGLLKTSECKCCDYTDHSKYNQFFAKLEKLKEDFDKTGTTDDKLEKNINEAETKLAEIKTHVLGNCKQSDDAFISDIFIEVRSELIDLQVKVDVIRSSLMPNSNCDSKTPCTFKAPKRNYKTCRCFCPLRCNATVGSIKNLGKCECEYLEDYPKIIVIRKQCDEKITKLSYAFREVETVNGLTKDLSDVKDSVEKTINGFKMSWDKTTIEMKKMTIENIVATARSVFKKSDAFINSGHCGETCTLPKLQSPTNCTCYTTTAIKLFLGSYKKFLSTESKIRKQNFKGDSVNQKYYFDWATNLKKEANSFHSKVTESIFDVKAQSDLLTSWIKNCVSFDASWKQFSDSKKNSTTTRPTCSVTCLGDNIKNCLTCKCLPIKSWADLNTKVYNGIDDEVRKIDKLIIDASDKKILKGNAEYIKKEIESLQNYTDVSCGNLDETYVQLLCLELVGFDLKLKSDIKAIENMKVQKACNVKCPNSAWKYDPLECSCRCNVSDCLKSTDAIDPYNCLCVKKSDCKITQSECYKTGQLLNYSKCKCMDKPFNN